MIQDKGKKEGKGLGYQRGNRHSQVAETVADKSVLGNSETMGQRECSEQIFAWILPSVTFNSIVPRSLVAAGFFVCLFVLFSI